jgi:hypothetical protein
MAAGTKRRRLLRLIYGFEPLQASSAAGNIVLMAQPPPSILLPPLTWEGGCQCKSVRYLLRALPLTLYACHCKECQLQSSSAFGLSMRVSAAAVEIKAPREPLIDLTRHRRPLQASFAPTAERV